MVLRRGERERGLLSLPGLFPFPNLYRVAGKRKRETPAHRRADQPAALALIYRDRNTIKYRERSHTKRGSSLAMATASLNRGSDCFTLHMSAASSKDRSEHLRSLRNSLAQYTGYKDSDGRCGFW